MLTVTDLHAYYGKSHILQGVDMSVGGGEIVALLGRNGVGRSTTQAVVVASIAVLISDFFLTKVLMLL